MVSLKTKILITLAGGFIFCDKTQGQNTDIIPLVEIPAGSFYMGSNGDGENFDESPVHKVHITHPFKMGRTEITNAQYELFRPEHHKLRGKNNVSRNDDDAVVNISYQDAVDFCKWLSKKKVKHTAYQQRLNGNMPVELVHTPYIIQEMDYLPLCVATR